MFDLAEVKKVCDSHQGKLLVLLDCYKPITLNLMLQAFCEEYDLEMLSKDNSEYLPWDGDDLLNYKHNKEIITFAPKLSKTSKHVRTELCKRKASA